jgi:hypothetical protein
MIAHIYILISIGGMIGIILHALRSMAAINKRNKYVNFRMVFDEYWKTDWFSLIVSFFSFIALVYVSSEFINYQDVTGVPPDPKADLKDKLIHFQIRNFIKASSVLAGYFADSIVYGWLGVAGKKLNQRFNKDTTEEKTDEKTG